MPLDTASIIGSLKPVQLDNPLDVQGKVMNLSALRDASAMNQIKLDETRRGQEETRTLNDLYKGAVNPDGTVNRQVILTGVAQRGLGSRLSGIQKGFADADKAQADVGHVQAQTKREEIQTIKAKLDISSGAISSLLSKPNVSHQDVIQVISGLVQQGIVDQNTGLQMLQSAPTNPADLRNWLISKGMETMDAAKRIELALPKTDVKDTGGAFIPVQTNQITGQVTAGAPIANKVQTPDSVAATGVSRDRLKFDKEQAGVANGVGGSITLPGFGKAPPGYMWDSTTQPPQLKPIKGGPAGAKPGAEVQRQLGGIVSFDKDLNALQDALKTFDPRNPADQADTTKRARIQSLAKQAQLSFKEAVALGALSGPDLDLILGIINDPTSMKGAVSGGAGIQAQMDEARAGNKRRITSLSQQYGPDFVSGLPADLTGGTAATPQSPVAPGLDAASIAAEIARRQQAKGGK